MERARRWGWARGVYLTLRLAVEMLGAQVPAAALDALAPARFDPAICQAARTQFFSDAAVDPANVPSTPFAALWESDAGAGKVRIVRSRLFPPVPTLARRYGVQPNTPAFYGCYVRLWAELLRRYAPVSGKLLRGDAALSEFVCSRQMLARWMADA